MGIVDTSVHNAPFYFYIKKNHISNLINSEIFNFRRWLYSVVVITFGFDPNNPGSNPGTTCFFFG